MENKSSNPLGNMGGKQAFGFGLVAGFLVLCAIGFFVLLGVILSDDTTASDNPTIEATDGPEKFSQCLDSGEKANIVKQDIALGSSLGVRGTPGAFINGYMISGAYPLDMLKQVIDTLLAGGEPDFDFLKDDDGNIMKVDMPELSDVVWHGGKDAKVTMVEFSDFECPYCSRFTDTVHQVLDEYGDQIKYTYRHFPLSFHANAQKAAEAFECAKDQDQWMEMHDKLFDLAKASSLSVDNFKKAARELGLK